MPVLMLAVVPLALLAAAGPAPVPAVERRNNERAIENFARCVVDTVPRPEIVLFLTADPFSREGHTFGEPLAEGSRCLHLYHEMYFSTPLFHSVLYEALYRSDSARRDLLPVTDQPALDFTAEFKPVGHTVSPVMLAERTFGDCVVRAAPASARAFVLANLYGAATDAASGALATPLSACTNTGQTLTFSRPILRGILAEALYKLTDRGPAGSATKPPQS